MKAKKIIIKSLYPLTPGEADILKSKYSGDGTDAEGKSDIQSFYSEDESNRRNEHYSSGFRNESYGQSNYTPAGFGNESYGQSNYTPAGFGNESYHQTNYTPDGLGNGSYSQGNYTPDGAGNESYGQTNYTPAGSGNSSYSQIKYTPDGFEDKAYPNNYDMRGGNNPAIPNVPYPAQKKRRKGKTIAVVLVSVVCVITAAAFVIILSTGGVKKSGSDSSGQSGSQSSFNILKDYSLKQPSISLPSFQVSIIQPSIFQPSVQLQISENTTSGKMTLDELFEELSESMEDSESLYDDFITFEIVRDKNGIAYEYTLNYELTQQEMYEFANNLDKVIDSNDAAYKKIAENIYNMTGEHYQFRLSYYCSDGNVIRTKLYVYE